MNVGLAKRWLKDRSVISIVEVGDRPEFELTNRSPIQVKQAVEIVAHYYKREMGFDNLFYDTSMFIPPTKKILLFMTSDIPSVGFGLYGFCDFNQTPYRNLAENYWQLSNVWFHPKHRNQGELKRRWPGFCKQFAPFTVQSPISPAMKGFLSKQKSDFIVTTCERKIQVPVYLE